MNQCKCKLSKTNLNDAEKYAVCTILPYILYQSDQVTAF